MQVEHDQKGLGWSRRNGQEQMGLHLISRESTHTALENYETTLVGGLEIIPIDEYFSEGVKPPTRHV